MIRKLVVWSVVVLFASGYTACKKTELTVETPKSEEQADTRTVADATAEQRTRGEVLAIATQLARGDSKGKTRAVPDFDVEYVLTSAVQKERFMAIGLAPVDTMLYILNERDGSGFSLISGDKRIPELLAYSDEGHLDIRHVDNPGLAIFLSRLPIFFEQELMKSDRVKREHFKEAPKEPEYDYRCTNWTYIYSPLCGSVSWGQEEPFNNKAPLRGGEHAAAGCVATAVAQFFRTARYPAWYNGQYLDWDFFTRYSNNETHTAKEKETFDDQVSRLFRSIGDALDNDWGKDATGAYFKDVPSLLRKAGFQNVPAITDYNYGTVLNSIHSGRQVFMRGCDEKWTTPIFGIPFYKGGHVWLCDGYLVRYRFLEYYEIETQKIIARVQKSESLLHCNWGWYGTDNGYFYEGVFNSNSPLDSTIRRPIYQGSIPYCYQYDIKQLVDVHP